MPVERLNFHGINRAVSDYGSAGSCEEMINLRPTTGGLVPVKRFQVTMNVTFDEVLIHYAGNATNYIAITLGSGNAVSIDHISASGAIIANIASFTTSAAITINDIHFASTGNIILFSICNKTNGVYDNRAFLWDRTQYNFINAEIPNISISLSDTRFSETVTGEAISIDDTAQQMIDKYESALNAIQEEWKGGCFGPTIIVLVLRANDGNTFWSHNWTIYDPIPLIQAAPLYYNSSSDIYSIRNGTQYTMYGTQVQMTLGQISGWDDEKSWFDSVEVYTSRPVLHAVPETAPYAPTFSSLYGRKYNTMELDNQLLYFQKSYKLRELVAESKTFTLQFGGNIQTTNKTLLVDAGELLRYGNLLSYNSRFHYYKSIAKVGLAIPMFSNENDNASSHSVFIRYNDGTTDQLVYVGRKFLPASTNTKLIISNSSRIKEVITYYIGYDGQAYTYTTKKYPMEESDRYNYSIFYDQTIDVNTSSSPVEEYATLISRGATSYLLQDEPSAINVTEQYNPFVFKVEHSYLAPGNILDVQPQLVAVRDVSFGDYPLNVFTDRGVYALLQGGGTVLYGSFRSISNLVSQSNSVPTEQGTFFIAAGGLWLVAGTQAVLVSDALSRGPHTFIRSCAGYESLSENGSVGYNITPYESSAAFDVFADGATLSYNRFRDELIISNPSYLYSYVLSLKYRQWFKMNYTLEQSVVGSQIASFKDGYTGKVQVPLYAFDDPDNYTLNGIELSLTIAPETYTPINVWGDTIAEIAAQLQYDINSSTRMSHLHGTTVTSRVIEAGVLGELTFNFPATAVVYASQISGTITPYYNYTPDSGISLGGFRAALKVLDFSQELTSPVLFHLQSRPFTIAYQYSHIYRVVSMIRSSLLSAHKVIVALYGSDDLQTWTLLSYADRPGTLTGLKISQVRTPSAARSWRYYTICIGGTVPVDTDLGPVDVDYQPVIRRIG